MSFDHLAERANQSRIAMGYLPLEDMLDLATRNMISDPFSVLVSNHVTIGQDNIFMPGCVINAHVDAPIHIGDRNRFDAVTRMDAISGPINIGHDNIMADGMVILRSNTDEARITIGDNTRINGHVSLFGRCDIGSGCQVLGDIKAISCQLGAGGNFQEADPDKRGAVLKGSGTAKNIHLAIGEVMNGQGHFDVPVERQLSYHPPAKR